MDNTNSVLDKARELGNSIIQSIEFQNLLKAEEDYHNDVDLLNLIETLNKIKDKYNSEKSTEHDDYVYLKEIKKLEQSLNENPTIKNLNIAKSNYDKLFKNINNLISYITDEESRVSVELFKDKKGCGGCGGCSAK